MKDFCLDYLSLHHGGLFVPVEHEAEDKIEKIFYQPAAGMPSQMFACVNVAYCQRG